MLTWVGLARTPLLFMTKHKSHADLPRLLLLWSMTMALRRPLPRTSEIHPPEGPTLCSSRRPARIFSPIDWARAARSSLTMTSTAALAPAHPSGFCECGVVKGELVAAKTPALGRRTTTHATVGRAVLAGEDGEEDVLAREHGRDGVDSAREGLAEENHVGLDVGVVLEAQELARARETLREPRNVSSTSLSTGRGENARSGPRRR